MKTLFFYNDHYDRYLEIVNGEGYVLRVRPIEHPDLSVGSWFGHLKKKRPL
jgi:hypothetical protein